MRRRFCVPAWRNNGDQLGGKLQRILEGLILNPNFKLTHYLRFT